MSSAASDPKLVLDEDRFFDPDPAIRKVARELYAGTRALPIISPHGHVEARLLADDAPFPEPTTLILTPDHYLLRMLYSQGVSLERLGIAPKDGSPAERDPRKIWQVFGDNYRLFRGTPSDAWLTYEFYHVFGVRTKLTGTTAQKVYDEIAEKLASPEFRPRALFERFRVELLATTDAATDSLEHHARIRASGWKGRVIPTFRPDLLLQIAGAGWRAELDRLGSVQGRPVEDYAGFIRALEERRAVFRSLGAKATDHDAMEPYTERLPDAEANRLFQLAREAKADAADQRRFQAHMLMEMARMSTADGMVMQLHAGSLREHNRPVLERFGPTLGHDIPVATEYTRNLRNLLNTYGNDTRFRLIVFTLDESTYARELAPLAGHYPAMRLGPAWWFHDSIEGMRRYRQQTTETAGIYNTAGFNDDTRGFCSIPARHDLSRRMDANWLAGLVARHIVDLGDAHEMARALAYDLAKDAYRL
ncbi:MAG TPA: glucuronate isomerase [Gemmatimonadales bacterium]|nr:glucuronate isomerase [Gemmatimonadales bacterium]